jgi:hypothetical protein
MTSMPPTKKRAGGEVRVVDSTNFPIAKDIAAALVTLKPGAMREMPDQSWQPPQPGLMGRRPSPIRLALGTHEPTFNGSKKSQGRYQGTEAPL